MTFPRSLPIAIVLSLLLPATACNSARTGDVSRVDMGSGHPDSGGGDVDSGSTGTDLGTPAVDLGTPEADLGTPEVDMGSTDVDMGSTASGACTNAGDMAILSAMDVSSTVGSCAMMHFGGEPATRDCIRSMTGLSNPCADCFDGEVMCSVMNCALRCFSDTPDCAACRAEFCDAAFATCSGLSP